MKKITLASFAVAAMVASTFATPALRHSQLVKPTMTAMIPPASCPANDPDGCGILDGTLQ